MIHPSHDKVDAGSRDNDGEITEGGLERGLLQVAAEGLEQENHLNWDRNDLWLDASQ